MRVKDLTQFQAGMDFLLYFSGQKFTLSDIQERYNCSYRNAIRMRNYAQRMVCIAPAGFDMINITRGGKQKFLMEIKKRG